MSFQLSRARVASRLALAAVISAGIAGCSTDTSRFADNPFSTASRSSPPPAEVTGSVQQSAPVSRIESQPLPAAQAALPPPPPPYRAPSPSYAPPPAPYRPAPPVATYHPPAPPQHTAMAPTPAPAMRAAAGIHIVAPHETLISIARHYKTSPAEIARANGIGSKGIVRLGQRLKIPGAAHERIHAAAAAPVAAPVRHADARPSPHARTLAPPERPLAPPPAKTAAVKPAPVKRAVVAQKALTPAKPQSGKVEKALIAAPVEETVAETKAGQPAATGAVPSFRWPVRGRIIAGFGPKPNGQENDGINLAVPEGTSVKAADDGVVAYAGNELKGYGNLVLVRHKDGYVTAYAHASQLKVHRGEAVKRGQIIALAGETGSVNTPQLHFEIRKGSTPVDPARFLTN